MQCIVRVNDGTVTFNLDDTGTKVLSVDVDGKSRALDISITKDDLSQKSIAAEPGTISSYDVSADKISVTEQVIQLPDKATKTVQVLPHRIHW